MRIRDWSSDVCSSDLCVEGIAVPWLPCMRLHVAFRRYHGGASEGWRRDAARPPPIDAREYQAVGAPGSGLCVLEAQNARQPRPEEWLGASAVPGLPCRAKRRCQTGKEGGRERVGLCR